MKFVPFHGGGKKNISCVGPGGNSMCIMVNSSMGAGHFLPCVNRKRNPSCSFVSCSMGGGKNYILCRRRNPKFIMVNCSVGVGDFISFVNPKEILIAAWLVVPWGVSVALSNPISSLLFCFLLGHTVV